MKIILLQVGKTFEKYIAEGVEEYSGRIRKYSAFDIVTVPELRNTRNIPVAAQKAAEGKQVTGIIGKDDYLVVLDENGREFSTREFAAQLGKIFLMSKKRVVFAVGGPFGFSDEVFSRADLRMSLSRLTFTHQMVRLLFTEQLYRALTIIKGDPYHHD